MFLINFDSKTRFLNLFKKYIVNNFSVFYYRNLIRGYFVTNWQGENLFLTVHFQVFSEIFVTFAVIIC
jgi:hypothetical protein